VGIPEHERYWEEITSSGQDQISAQHQATSLEADVLVIGAGAAGLPAAVAAMEQGAKRVVLVEQRPSLGGNASRAEGVFACASRVQRRAFVSASSDEIFKQTMNWHHYSRVDPKILRAYLNKSGDTVDWLEEKGVVFTLGTRNRLRFNQNFTWHIPEGHCASIVRALAQDCRDTGVQILTRTCVKRLLVDSAGQVTGVLAEKDKEELRLNAKSVVIATGGFTGNEELLTKYFPYYKSVFFVPGLPLAGDGIRLAGEAGAAIEDYACMLKETGFGASPLTFSLVREPCLVCVNKKGERFLGEDSLGFYPMECGNVVIRQPDMLYYALFDEEFAQTVETRGFLVGRPGVRRGEPGIPVPGFRQELRDKRHADWVTIGESWDDIAAWLGAEPEVLNETIREYNSFCDQGHDEAFVKDRDYLLSLRTPPYYAARVQPMITETIGPIRINEHMEVLDRQNDPIRGLYAAGVIASGWQSEEYCSEICGSAMGFSLNSGRIAAENAAAFAKGQ
jgi:fumarate reductase flavoprotein subunit